MRHLILIISLFFTTIAIGQIERKSLEQLAINYLVENLIDKEYSNIKTFIFDGNLETQSALGYSFCMPLPNKGKESKTTKVDIPKSSKVRKKIGFLNKLFTSKKKIIHISIFRAYSLDNDNKVVVIYLSGQKKDRFYSFKYNSKTKKLIEYCSEDMYM